MTWYIATTTIVLLLVLSTVVVTDWRLTQLEANRVAESVARHVADSVSDTLSAADFGGTDDIDRDQLLGDLQGYFDSGMVMRIKVWKVEGDTVRVVFSDESAIEGEVRSFSAELADRLDAGEAVVLPVPDDAEHRFEHGSAEELRETFIGFTDSAGNAMRLEAYTPVHAKAMTERSLALQLPIMLGGLLLLAAILILLAMALFKRLHALTEQRHHAMVYAETARDDERRALARQLHDGVIQDIAGAAMVLKAAAGTAPGGNIDARSLRRIADILGEDTHQLRSLLSEFYDTPVTGHTLQQALAEAVERLPAEGVDITLDAHPGDSLSDEAAAVIYRAAREFIRNALTHSGAANISVLVATDKSGTRLTVGDDGSGFDPARRDRAGHFGLALVEHSVNEAGGRVDIDSRPGGGAVLTVRIPAGA